MPAKNPRVNVVLDPPLYERVQFLARRDGVSLSTKVRDLLRDSVEINEDVVLSEFAVERDKSFDKSKALSHQDVWK